MQTAIKKSITCAALALAAAYPAQALDLLITEINSNASLGDFWELTNFGSTAINLFNGSTPWSWDDNSFTAGSVTLPLGLSIAPGESMVFLADQTNTANFRSGWALSASVQIIPDTTGTGLGSGDAVTLYDGAGQAVAALNYAAGGFTRANGSASVGGHAGLSAGGSGNTQSAIWDPTSGTTPATARYTFADGTNYGTYDAPGSTGFGSPGAVTAIPEPSSAILATLGGLAITLRRRRSQVLSSR